MTGCAAKLPSDIELNASSNEAVLLMFMQPLDLDYLVDVVTYNAATKQTGNEVVANNVLFNSNSIAGAHFEAKVVKPGTYVVQSFSRQGHWTLCFHANSYAFTIAPGQVLTLGRFQPEKHLIELNRSVQASGQTTAQQYQAFQYFDDVSPPQLEQAPNGPGSLAEARNFVTKQMSKVHSGVEFAALRPAKFGTGTSILGKTLCGGLFKKPVSNAVQ